MSATHTRTTPYKVFPGVPGVPQPAKPYVSWQSETGHLSVRTNPEVLEAIRLEAVQGYVAGVRGGFEIGGVLFGLIEATRVTVVAARPLNIEYAHGPSFLLTETDEEKLAALIQSCDSDPDLLNLVSVGWYHSHTRSEICLTSADVDLHERFFPKTAQVALVVKPSKTGSGRGGFFVRERDGSMPLESRHREFSMDCSDVDLLPLTSPTRRSGPVEGKRRPTPLVVAATLLFCFLFLAILSLHLQDPEVIAGDGGRHEVTSDASQSPTAGQARSGSRARKP